eukprot:3033315-Pyramimonas_sp.AAC.1
MAWGEENTMHARIFIFIMSRSPLREKKRNARARVVARAKKTVANQRSRKGFEIECPENIPCTSAIATAILDRKASARALANSLE